MSNRIGFAILGAGVAADYHRRAIAANADQGAQLVAVGHYDPTRFDEIGAAYDAPCLTFGELLAHPSVDVVCICTPSGQHAEQAMAGAEAGKHVLVEKPMALTLADADAMIAACQKAGVLLGVTLQRRAEPLYQRVQQAVAAGELGRLVMGLVTMPYYRPMSYFEQADWRGSWALDGGGVLINQGIHLVDLLIWLMGDPVAVQASAGTIAHDIEVEDILAATLRFDSGALATITATTAVEPGFPHRLEFYGTQGGIQIEGESLRRWDVADSMARFGKSPARDLASGSTPEESREAEAGAAADPRGIAPTGHIAIVRDFIEAVRTGRTPHIDGAEGRRSLKTVLAIYEAAGLI